MIWRMDSGSVEILPERGRILGIRVAGHQSLWQRIEKPSFAFYLVSGQTGKSAVPADQAPR